MENNLEQILSQFERRNIDVSDIDIDSDDLNSQIFQKRLESIRYGSDTKDRKWLAG